MPYLPLTVPGGHRPQLDGLRALAVGLVIISHWIRPLPLFLPIGPSGVAIFFVLSGYLITGILLDARDAYEPSGGRAKTTLKAFYLRRAVRIIPAYALFLLVMSFDPNSPIHGDVVWYATYTSNFHLSGAPQWAGNLAHLWSLAVEEQFYLVWPLATLFVPRRHIGSMIASSFLVATAFRFLMPVATDVPKYSTIPPVAFQGLIAGAALTYLVRQRSETATALRNSLWPLAAIGVAAIALSAFNASPFVNDLRYTVLLGFFAALVLAAAVGFEGRFGRFLESRSVQYLGRISYGLYLWHLAPEQLTRAFGYDETLLVITKLAITLVVASLSYHLFEAPINSLKHRWNYLELPEKNGAAAAADRTVRPRTRKRTRLKG